MSKFLRCFNFVKAFGNLPLDWLPVTFKCVNLVQCKIDCGMVPLMLLLAKLTTLNFWSLHRESASIVPLRFKFSSLICTTLVAFELHLTPFNLTKHGCDGDSIQVMLSTFFGSRALMKLKKDSDSDDSPLVQSTIKKIRIAKETSLLRNTAESLMFCISFCGHPSLAFSSVVKGFASESCKSCMLLYLCIG